MKRYILDCEYPRLLRYFGVDAAEALRAAHLPEDTFAHQPPTMTAEGYFAFMEAVRKLSPRKDLAVNMAGAEGIEQFSPPIFASYCSPNARVCIERLARYKRLIGPMEFRVEEREDSISIDETRDELSIELTLPGGSAAGSMISETNHAERERNRNQGDAADCGGVTVPEPQLEPNAGCKTQYLEIPPFLVECEFVFLVSIIRSATKQHIRPRSIMMRQPPKDDGFDTFMGRTPAAGPRNTITFDAADMDKPFISHNEAMWSYFEPELKRRLSELEVDDTMAARVRSALVEMLPAGEGSADDVAKRLGVSRRTMQRRLGEEGTSFQKQLNHTRELLAKHYLSTTVMTTDQIAYMLGYLELNSFLRAFTAWTGESPTRWRETHAE